MKRKIKFRGKCAGTWRYGDHLTYRNGECIKAWMGSISPEYTVEPDSVGQFIGAYDKDGKEIYEGDILIFVDEVNPNKKHKPYYVQYDSDCCKFRLYELNGGKTKAVLIGKYYKVIGNIFDDPELLEVNEEGIELREQLQFNFTQVGNNNTVIGSVGTYVAN